MFKAIICTTIIVPLLVSATDAYAEEVEGSEFEVSGVIMTTHNYNGGIIGVTVSEGTHIQGVLSVDHKSGMFVETFTSTDAILSANDPAGNFEGEVDLSVGYRGTKGEVSYQIDYSVFWIDTANGVKNIQNVRAFVNWNRENGPSFYAAGQLFVTEDFGPGKGLAYKAGARFEGFNLEAGGHTGLFRQDAAAVSFVRAGWSGEVKGLGVSAYVQKGLADPIEDTFSVSVVHRF